MLLYINISCMGQTILQTMVILITVNEANSNDVDKAHV